MLVTDFAVSGASMDRTGMRGLLAAIQANQLDVIVTESVDRISRDVGDADRFRKLLAHHSVDLACLDGTRITPGDKSAPLLFGVRALVAEQYLADLADKTRRGLDGRQRSGFATGAVAFGYITVDGGQGRAIQIDGDRAAIVRRVFELYASGISMERVAVELNSAGLSSPRGRDWTVGAVRSMLVNPVYRGTWSYGRREWRKVPGTNTRRPRAALTGASTQERPHLAIIDDALWTAVSERFAGHTKRLRAKRAHMLSGLLRCAACDNPMQDAGGSSTTRYYKCAAAKRGGRCANRAALRCDRAEQAFIETLHASAKACLPELVDLAREEIRSWSASRDGREAAISAELTRVSKEIENIAVAIARTGTTALDAQLRTTEAKQRTLLAEREALGKRRPSPAPSRRARCERG